MENNGKSKRESYFGKKNINLQRKLSLKKMLECHVKILADINVLSILKRIRVNRYILHSGVPTKILIIKGSLSCVKSVSISRKRCRTGKRTDKSQARKYFFDNHGQTVRACKMFFRNTLSISQTFITTALKKLPGRILATDERGRHGNHSKIPEFVRQAVRDHIMQFPVEDSHYSRERTKRKYLGNHLNLSKIYNLCTNVCEEKNLPV